MSDKKSIKEQTQAKEPIDWKKEILSWVIIVVVAYLLAICITKFIIIKTEIISGSMIHTLEVDDLVIGNRLAYLFDEPERGEIIFFAFPDDESKTYVKRIIGLPGETVEIVDGKVYINGSSKPLDEPYLKEEMIGSFGPYTVPEGGYFVLGDNRNVSVDSRFWDNQFVTKKQIFGKAWFRCYPKLGAIKHATYD